MSSRRHLLNLHEGHYKIAWRGMKEDVKKYVSGEQINSMKECRNLSYKFSEITMLIRFSFRNVMK